MITCEVFGMRIDIRNKGDVLLVETVDIDNLLNTRSYEIHSSNLLRPSICVCVFFFSCSSIDCWKMWFLFVFVQRCGFCVWMFYSGLKSMNMYIYIYTRNKGDVLRQWCIPLVKDNHMEFYVFNLVRESIWIFLLAQLVVPKCDCLWVWI